MISDRISLGDRPTVCAVASISAIFCPCPNSTCSLSGKPILPRKTNARKKIFDLRHGQSAHIFSAAQRAVPIDAQLEGLIQADRRMPIEAAVGLRAIELEEGRLVQVAAFVDFPAS